jgi:hypothetical protein
MFVDKTGSIESEGLIQFCKLLTSMKIIDMNELRRPIPSHFHTFIHNVIPLIINASRQTDMAFRLHVYFYALHAKTA